jgi:outer membrane usher protein
MPAPDRHDSWFGYGSNFLLLFYSLTLLIFFCQVHAEEDTSNPPSQAVPVLLRMTINGAAFKTTVMALQTPDKNWWLPVDILSASRIQLPKVQPIHFNGSDFYSVKDIGVEKINFDESSQTLDIQFAASVFQLTRLQPDISATSNTYAAPSGLFVNYDLLFEQNPAGLRQSIFSELGSAAGPGVATSSFAYLQFGETAQHLRLDTTYTIDRPADRASWRIGDTISRPGSMLGRPARFGGLQYSTNFLTQPGLIITPMTTLGGQAALPSTLDLYVNNVMQSSSQILPGPFSVSTAPIVAGDGEVSMRVRDIAGREEIISQRFYASTALLSPGLSDFSFEGGFLRQNFGRESNDYGDFFGSASYRLGLRPTLTAEGSTQFQQGGLTAFSGGITSAFAGVGTATLAMAYSHSYAGDGLQSLLGFERRSGRHSFALRTQFASENFRQVGVDTAQIIRRLDTAFWGYRVDGLGSFSLSYLSQQANNNRSAEIYSASFSTLRYTWGTFVVSAMQSRAETSQSSVYFLWVLPLEREVSASVMHLRGSNQQDQTIFQANKSLPPGEGVGYRLQAAVNASQQAAVFGQNRYGLGRLEVAELNGQTSARASVTGAIASLDDQWFLTPRINSSYGLVRMPGLNNVRVYVDNQLASRTNSDGYAFLPRLHPYVRNHVSVDQLDLPIDATIDTLTVRPVPAWRSGVVIDFPVRQQAAATLNLVQADGKAVPPGALIRMNQADNIFAVGREGLTFVSGLEKENQLTVSWGSRRCKVLLPFSAPKETMIPHLGEFICRELEP